MESKGRDHLVKPAQAWDRLQVSPRKFWDLVSTGKLKTVKLGKRCTRIRESDLQRLVEKGV